mmetsp:Transcript_35334/g.76278  ORF Transcript_35334/g.76278 Transcript_35334/m.76278 type:complete len:111 (+) Transcript_35334:229-561(+)
MPASAHQPDRFGCSRVTVDCEYSYIERTRVVYFATGNRTISLEGGWQMTGTKLLFSIWAEGNSRESNSLTEAFGDPVAPWPKIRSRYASGQGSSQKSANLANHATPTSTK